MERLAAQGIRFSTFYAQSVCSPTRVSLMTGQNSARHHTTQWIRPDSNNRGPFGPADWNWKGLGKESVTLPRLLQSAGYRTVHLGKGHFGPVGHVGTDPRNIGFDVNIGGSSAGQPTSYYGEKNYGNQPDAKSQPVHAVPHLDKYHGTNTFLTEALTLEAKGQIDQALSDNKSFFVYLPHYAVHGPHQSDPRFAADYKNGDKSPQAQAFATLIAGVDKSLGDLLDHVNQRGIGRETLVIFVGDNGSDAPLGPEHGYSSSAPLRGKKGTHYEGGTRVPFLAAWAQPDRDHALQKQWPIVAGGVQTQLGTVMDLFPTILELTGVAAPAGHPLDGVSLRRQFSGERNADRQELFLSHFPHDHRSSYFTALRSGEWKVIYHYLPGRDGAADNNAADPPNKKGKNGAKKQEPAAPPVRYELYHLAKDPYETTNLADKEPAKLKEMMRQLVQRLETEQAQYPVSREGKILTPIVP
jgi:arylsulfatase A-like enzyme